MDWNLAPLHATIRPARVDDADFLIALSKRVFRQYLSNAAGVMLRMMRNPACKIAVAESLPAMNGPEIRLGFVVVNIKTLDRPYGPWSRPSVAHLDAIAVRPNIVGCGLGRRLLLHAEEIARSHEALSMSLLTAQTTTRAKRLFQSAGYQVLAPFDDVYDDGRAAFAMWKAL
jgi:ribosomal protein S18 acetylase RimI-like enzyme